MSNAKESYKKEHDITTNDIDGPPQRQIEDEVQYTLRIKSSNPNYPDEIITYKDARKRGWEKEV